MPLLLKPPFFFPRRPSAIRASGTAGDSHHETRVGPIVSQRCRVPILKVALAIAFLLIGGPFRSSAATEIRAEYCLPQGAPIANESMEGAVVAWPDDRTQTCACPKGYNRRALAKEKFQPSRSDEVTFSYWYSCQAEPLIDGADEATIDFQDQSELDVLVARSTADPVSLAGDAANPRLVVGSGLLVLGLAAMLLGAFVAASTTAAMPVAAIGLALIGVPSALVGYAMAADPIHTSVQAFIDDLDRGRIPLFDDFAAEKSQDSSPS